MLSSLEPVEDLVATERIGQLEASLGEAHAIHASAEADRQATIAELEEEVDRQRRVPDREFAWRGADDVERWLGKLAETNKTVRDQYEAAYDRTAELLAEQEKTLLRAFKARLFDGHQELVALRRYKEDKASSWIARHRQLEADFDFARDTSRALKRGCAKLAGLNKDLRRRTSAAEKRRTVMISELVLRKKEAKALREELDRLECAARASTTQPVKKPRVKAAPVVLAPKKSHTAVTQLQRQIDAERHRLARARQDYASALRSSADLRELLRCFCSGVRARIVKCQNQKPRRPRTAVVARKHSLPSEPQLEFWDLARRIAPSRRAPAEAPAPPPVERPEGQAPRPATATTAATILEGYELQLRVVTQLARRTFPAPAPPHTIDPHRRPKSAVAVPRPHHSSDNASNPRPSTARLGAATRLRRRTPYSLGSQQSAATTSSRGSSDDYLPPRANTAQRRKTVGSPYPATTVATCIRKRPTTAPQHRRIQPESQLWAQG